MLRTFNSMLRAVNSRIEDKSRERQTADMLGKKIRDGKAELKSIENTLHSLRKRKKLEELQFDSITARIADLTERAKAAQKRGEENLLQATANAIADLENERSAREATVSAVSARIARLSSGVKESTAWMSKLQADLKNNGDSVQSVLEQREIAQCKTDQNTTETAEEKIDALMEKRLAFKDEFTLRDAKESSNRRSYAGQRKLQHVNARPQTTPDQIIDRLRVNSVGT